MKILAIGNSFSEDATTYLHDIAKADGKVCKIVNLYIGGCSLETHWNNVINDSSLYAYELNGSNTGQMVSMKEALQEEEWDYVTMQQASGYSGMLETYYPYIIQLSDYVRQHAPKVTQLLHQTWAYEIDSQHPHFVHYDNDQKKMYQAIVEVYQRLSKELSLRVIPCGDVIQALRSHPLFDYEKGGESLCRDGFHMNLIYGRYALGVTWFAHLFGQSIRHNSYMPPVSGDITLCPDKLALIKDTVMQTLSY